MLERLQSVDATVFTIGLGTSIDRESLERLASGLGRRGRVPGGRPALPQEFRRILENLRQPLRHRLHVDELDPRRAWRKVQILSTTPGVTSVSRGGYFAPPQ